MDSGGNPFSLLDELIAGLLSIVAWLTRSKVKDMENQHNNLNDRLSMVEREHVSIDTLNQELDTRTEALHEDIREIKAGQAEIMRTLISVIRGVK